MNKATLEALKSIQKGLIYSRDELATQPRNLEVYEVIKADADCLGVLIDAATKVKRINKLSLAVD